MTARDHLSIAGLEGYLAELGAESRPPAFTVGPTTGFAPRPPVFSPAAMRFVTRNMTLSAATRAALQQVSYGEQAAARAMTDEVFWSYDRSWFERGAPTFVDMRQAGACGGGGCNMSWNNSQYWSLAQACDRGVFSLIMFQQRRYIAAQLRIARHLLAVPQPEIVRGFDRRSESPEIGVREACGGVEVKTKAVEWAYWCEEALRLIGVARWASNFSWSDGSKTCGDMSYRPDVNPIVGSYETGCRYAPDCSADKNGVPRLGYIAGKAINGIAQWERVTANVSFPSMQPARIEAARAGFQWPDARLRQFQGIVSIDGRVPFGFGSRWPLSVAPIVLGLHKETHPGVVAGAPVVIPTDSQAFNGYWSALAVGWPPFLERPANLGGSVGDWLLALFLEQPTGRPGLAEQLPLREQTGCWFWKHEDRGFSIAADGIARGQAHSIPGSEIIIWRLIAHLRDIASLDFGTLIIDGFSNLSRAIEGIPAAFRGVPEATVASIRQATQTVVNAQAGAVSGAFAIAGTGAGLVNPLAAIVVAVLAALVDGLLRAWMDVGFARPSNPPMIQAPVMRVAPPTPEGDDRCWINPGATEALDAYKVRVADPFAEAARRASGDPGRLFDLVPEVRAEQFCQRNPTHPRCVAPPPPPPDGGGDVKGGGGGLLIGAAALLLLSRFLR